MQNRYSADSLRLRASIKAENQVVAGLKVSTPPATNTVIDPLQYPQSTPSGSASCVMARHVAA